MTCTYCSGKKLIAYPEYLHWLGWESKEYKLCPKCNGTGEIPDKQERKRMFKKTLMDIHAEIDLTSAVKELKNKEK